MENYLMKAVNLPLVQAYNLLALLKATYPELASMNERCADIRIYVDDLSAGNVYIGNSDVSTTNYGSKLVSGGQTTPSAPQDWNVIPIGDIWLLPVAADTEVGVTILYR